MNDLPGRLLNQAEGLLDEWNSEELEILLTEAADTIARQAAVIARVEALAESYTGYLEDGPESMYDHHARACETFAEELRAALKGDSNDN